MKRTTLILQENRLAELKKIAAEQEKTVSDLVDEILAAGIIRYKSPPKNNKTIKLPSFPMGEACVDITDRDRLEDLMNS